jgi:hypothetical protein
MLRAVQSTEIVFIYKFHLGFSPLGGVIRMANHSSYGTAGSTRRKTRRKFTSREFQTLVNVEAPCTSVQ